MLITNAGGVIISSKRENPFVVLVVGVNGVGKTTTIAKLAYNFKLKGAKVLIAAADTFRAAAAEQIEVWADRAGVDVISGEESAKPSTVVFQAMERAKEERYDVLIIDTAGRLHTRVNLMSELKKIVEIIKRKQENAPHESLLILDATTGQNALQQTRAFQGTVKLTGLVVTKLDGTPKGGVVFGICDELGIPVRYIGVGEKMDDLREFNAEQFVNGIFEEG